MTRTPQEPRNADTPTPGFYRCRLVPRGPLVPARIMRTDDNLWLVLIDGEPTMREAQAEPWSVPRMSWVNFSEQITEDEYSRMRNTSLSVHRNEPVDFRRIKTLTKEADDGIS